MRVAIFAEGRSDLAVLTNILKGKLNIDRIEIRYELPEYNFDQTDLADMPPEQFSNWTLVRKKREEKTKISGFLDYFDENRFIVIQIDTDERNLKGYDVPNPVNKNTNAKQYCSLLRTNIIEKINEWLKNDYTDRIAYAIGIEEIEAWVMTIYTHDNSDTSEHNDPKRKLDRILTAQFTGTKKNILRGDGIYRKYFELSVAFRKKKSLPAFMNKNECFKTFCDSLDRFS